MKFFSDYDVDEDFDNNELQDIRNELVNIVERIEDLESEQEHLGSEQTSLFNLLDKKIFDIEKYLFKRRGIGGKFGLERLDALEDKMNKILLVLNKGMEDHEELSREFVRKTITEYRKIFNVK